MRVSAQHVSAVLVSGFVPLTRLQTVYRLHRARSDASRHGSVARRSWGNRRQNVAGVYDSMTNSRAGQRARNQSQEERVHDSPVCGGKRPGEEVVPKHGPLRYVAGREHGRVQLADGRALLAPPALITGT